METSKNNKVNKITTLNSIHLERILHYITLTNYYFVKEMTSNHSNENVEREETKL